MLIAKRAIQLAVKVAHVVGYEVGQVSVLAVVPDLLNGIEFRGIGREPLSAEPPRVLFAEQPDRLAMNVIAVKHENERPLKVPPDQCDKFHGVIEVNVVRVNSEV